jgi:hypothetical protein
MDNLATHLALHGVLVLIVSVSAGLLLYRSILGNGNQADWHLLHAGGSARGILLIALAAIISLPDLPFWQTQMAAWFIIYFAWTSTLAMLIRAISGETGFRLSGSTTNKFVFVLYATGAVVLFPGLFVLAIGLSRAL